MIQHTIVNMWTLLLLQRSRFLMGPLHIITFQFCIDEFVQNFSSSTFYTSFFYYNFFEFFLPFLIPIFFSSLGSCEFSFWVQQEYDVYLRLRMRYLEWKVGWTVFSLPHLLPSSSLSVSLPLPPSLSLGTLWLHIKFSESTADQQTLRKFD